MKRTVRFGLGGYELLLLGAFCFLLAGCSTPETSTAGEQKFIDFWPEFRAAAMTEDTARLESLTAFPFEVQGTLDTQPAHTYDRADFRSLAPRLLNQDSGLTEKGESMKKLLQRSSKAPAAVGGKSRFGNFEFRKTRDGWRFIRAYLED